MAWNVNKDLVKGNDMYLYLVELGDDASMTSGMVETAKVVAYATSCSLQADADTMDVSSKFSCRWQAVVPGNASYQVSSDALYCQASAASANSGYTVDNLFDAMVEGKNIGWVMAQDNAEGCTVGGPDTTKPYYWGEAAVTSLSITAGNNEIVTSSIQLQGSGALNYKS